MTAADLQSIVVAFFAAMIAACLWGLVAPRALIGAVRKGFDERWGMPAAVIVRVILGVVFIVVAPDTRYPMFFRIVGVLALGAAVALPFLGKERIRKLMARVDRWPDLVVRLWVAAGALFCLFIIYAVT